MYYVEPSYEESINSGMYISYAGSNRFLICNNIFAANSYGSNPVFIKTNDPDHTFKTEIFFFNNTVIKDGEHGGAADGYTLVFQDYEDGTVWIDSLTIKNNLVTRYNEYNQTILIGREVNSFTNKYKDVDYNRYYKADGGAFRVGYSGGGYSWAQWRALDGSVYDQHSDTTGAITFNNLWGEDFNDYIPNQGEDEGVNLTSLYPELVAAYPDLLNDINGNPRGSGNGLWDLGAVESSGTASNDVDVKSKIFLQGPYNPSNGSMFTLLNQGNYLPSSQPYNVSPWNYNGNESFNPGSNSSVVDWVLVELRNPSTPNQIGTRQAALIKNNGIILDANGNEGVTFNNVNPGSYFVVIYHRNHLPIMSATPVQLSSNSTLYDFTTAMNKAYGQEPMIELSPGKFGMIGGNGNADYIIDPVDRDEVWSEDNGQMGYLKGDFDMNTGVNINDANQLWNLSNGKQSGVPHN